jgi:hypothetical protein
MHAAQAPTLLLLSRGTTVRLCVAWLVAAALCAWFFVPVLVCNGQALSCAQFGVLAAASLAYGLAFAAFYAALAVILSLLVQRVRPEVPSLESPARALLVVVCLFLLQVVVLGCIAALGALPARWPWWLGTLGAFWL